MSFSAQQGRVWVFTGAALTAGFGGLEASVAEEEVRALTELTAIEVVGGGGGADPIKPLVRRDVSNDPESLPAAVSMLTESEAALSWCRQAQLFA
ncbi:hypothetical protein [Pseudomonas vlassakiae]|uniref:Uncharacterized protein n=1 Tax=Pseudomonas vlassakiae TaxID=485888 RepID=A0A923K7N6_9PSED|nr:hypothetical protein [Pseudomonas vlassakiae]MBV4542827.1 hypothetical protein [Pseudomonas vlassakiae]